MVITKKIKVGKKYIAALAVKLLSKNLILLRGSKGYVMCGYLNLSAANKFKDVAIKIVSASTITEALNARVHSCTYSAERVGIYKNQSIKDVLRIIA